MSAYNAGEGRYSALLTWSHEDFTGAFLVKALQETRNYVPKMMAAVKIGRNLENITNI